MEIVDFMDELEDLNHEHNLLADNFYEDYDEFNLFWTTNKNEWYTFFD